ncbi:TPA: transketolase [Candidatus Woesearchaeota archaeon]|nr:transketolase [Candidatus Woesearchaeota archaeon]
MNNKELALLSNTARQEIIKMLVRSKSGHTAGSLGMADIFITLYYDHAKTDAKNPGWEGRDYVYLSNGHICPVWYTTLAMRGFFSIDELSRLRQINSLLQGHPHNETIPGIENSGGPLGQGISQAAGCALALQRDKKPNRVYCMLGDGELDEGQVWEAFMFAGKYKLDNLTAIVDRNNIQIDGYTTDVMDLEPLADKFRAFNWNVIALSGHDHGAIKKALAKAASTRGKPTVIIAKTTPGKGVKAFEDKYEWHGKTPSEEEGKRALEELQAERANIEKRWF